jgi:predicted nucleic acid-binding protein
VPNTAAWVDTGFLVALFAANDSHHESAVEFLRESPKLELHSIWPVVTEAGFFLGPSAKDALLAWLEEDTVVLHPLELNDLSAVRATLQKYRNLGPDFTDAMLVTLATRLGIDAILTGDVRDFSAYRLGRNKTFRRLWR